MRRLLQFVALAVFSAPLAMAQSNSAQSAATKAAPCSQQEFRQMDFWVGEWTATWPGQKGQPQVEGSNVIRKILGDCVIEENFRGPAFEGKSVSTFNARSGHWQQTWVDSGGGYLDFVGGMDGENFVYTREFTASGKKTMQRMVYKNIKPDGFDWSWERSDDSGKTWTVLWPIHYTRKTVSAAR